jgi:para-aminobenzoate synthetase component 1
MTKREAFHLAIPLEAPVTSELLRAAFPDPSAARFVLDGGGAGANACLDRGAFMGAAPAATFRARRTSARDAFGRVLADVVIATEGAPDERHSGIDPFAALDRFLRAHALPSETFDPRCPLPFRAGLVGYIGYECGQALEQLPATPRPSLRMPDMALSLHRWVIGTCRETETSWLSIVGLGETPTLARADAETTRERVLSALRAAPTRSEARRDRVPRPNVVPDLSASEYMAAVVTAKEHITTGDAFEICLTNALRTAFPRALAGELFDELRRSNPAPFAALLELPEGAVVSSSPERFLALDERGMAESRPIKGTRPRGTSPEDDARLVHELATSEKDRAENAMIVDLVRNDLGRVCRFGTVQAPELFAVEPYASVHQLVSTVRGELTEGSGAIDLVRACFPPGSMTGAPKIEAMTILERLEPAERGVYSGALGWFDLGGAMDLSVVIRTIVLEDGAATLSVGGAVVTDSEPRAEHEETEHKARALIAALEHVAHASGERT